MSLKKKVKIVSKDTEEHVGWRETEENDDLWFACIEYQGQRCPFPFAVDLQDDEDNVPIWLTNNIKVAARTVAWETGARMSCYATEETPKIAVKFTAFRSVWR